MHNFSKNILFFLMLIISLIAALQLGTQYLAWQFNYHPSLGFNVGHIYPFYEGFIWHHSWQDRYPQLFNDALWIAEASFSLFIILAAVIRYFFFGHKAKSVDDMHGTAHWATRQDIENATFLPKKGAKPPKEKEPTVYVGAWKDPKTKKVHYLKHSGPEHILAYAPTRSGKGVGLVLPSLLTWSQSAVVWDIKGELAALTSGWRKKYAKNNIFIFKPMVAGFSRWNPLEEIRIGDVANETKDIQNLSQTFANPDGEKVDHWLDAAINGFQGLIAFEIYRAKAEDDKPSLLNISKMIADPNFLPQPEEELDEPEKWIWLYILKKINSGKVAPDIANLARMNAKTFIDTPDREYGSKMSTLGRVFALFRNQIIAENVSACDFKLDDLMHNDKPSTCYVVIEPTDLKTAKPIVKVFFNMMVQKLCREQKFEGGRAVANYKHRLLCMFDEFTSLEKLEAISHAIPFAAGYGLKFYIVCQDTSQLANAYGKDDAIAIAANCNIKITYASNTLETAEQISKMSGIKTVVKESISESLSKNGKVTGISRSFQETQRPLITADEAMRLKSPLKNAKGEITEAGDMLIFPYGFHPIFGTQILYFKDETLLARAKAPSVGRPDIIKHEDRKTVENLAKNLKQKPTENILIKL